MSNTKRPYDLFNASGCLTTDGMKMYFSSKLTPEEKVKVDKHVEECELCNDALQGLAFLPDFNKLDSNVEKINTNLKEILFPKSSKNPIKIIWSNNRVFYFSAAASVLVLIGIFSYLKFYLEDSDTKISVVTEKPVKKDQNPQASFTEQEEIEYPLSESKKYAERKENETINKQEQKPESKNIVQIVEDDTELESEIKNNNQALNGMDEEVLYPPIAILEPEEPVKIVVEEDVIVTDKGMERNAEGMVVSMEATGSKKHDGKGSRDQKGNEEPNGWAKISKDADTAFEEAQIFTVVETMPSFPGGEEERIKFLNDNIKYPQMARESGIQGSVFVTFVVERDGKITDARVLRGIGGGCDEEALRVIRKMPDWIPGKQRGKAVRVQFNFPIEFILN